METIQTLKTTIDYLRDLEKTLSKSKASIGLCPKKVQSLIEELNKLIENLENGTPTKYKEYSFNDYTYWLDKAIEIIQMIIDFTS